MPGINVSQQTQNLRFQTNPVATLIFLLVFFTGLLGSLIFINVQPILTVLGIFISFVFAYIIASSAKIAFQWEKAVVLRLGRYSSLKGPGLFFVIPILDTIPYWVDVRTITSNIKAEQTLTKDNVAVDIDSIVFWKVVDPKRAALEVVNYNNAVSLASQTALRDTIGKTTLAEMLTGRESIDSLLKQTIDSRTEPWGIEVISVEIRDVVIPKSLQNAMSMQAQAEREMQARVILGDSERQIAQNFIDAAKLYEKNPTALHLRAMNMLYEGLKEKGALVVVPSSALETMNLGAIGGLGSYQQQVMQQQDTQDNSEAEKIETPKTNDTKEDNIIFNNKRR